MDSLLSSNYSWFSRIASLLYLCSMSRDMSPLTWPVWRQVAAAAQEQGRSARTPSNSWSSIIKIFRNRNRISKKSQTCWRSSQSWHSKWCLPEKTHIFHCKLHEMPHLSPSFPACGACEWPETVLIAIARCWDVQSLRDKCSSQLRPFWRPLLSVTKRLEVFRKRPKKCTINYHKW